MELPDLELRRFDDALAPLVASWVTSADEAQQWCGRRLHPFPADVVLEWQKDAEAFAHVLLVDGVPAGYGAVWPDPEEDEVELANLIVAPGQRGRGVGRELVTRLRDVARGTGLGQIVLRVNPENENALRCYAAAGFTRVSAAEEQAWNTGQPVAYVWLRD